MRMPSNIEVFNHSVANEEPLIDKYYCKEEFILSKDPNRPNELMRLNSTLIENIVAYKVLREAGDKIQCEEILNTIQLILQNEGMNNSEFAAFWVCNDVSYSVYRRFDAVRSKEFLREIIDNYISKRHNYYTLYGYTPITLQVIFDSFAHKRSGQNAIDKLQVILSENGYIKDIKTDFVVSTSIHDKRYIFVDNAEGKFIEALTRYGIEFSWSARNNRKLPDALLTVDGHFFVIEMKHMKETGGGQNKQIVELLDFLKQVENNAKVIVHYVSFLDGILFNELVNYTGNGRKGVRGVNRMDFINALNDYPKNYFVNTAGLRFLLWPSP